MPTWIAIIKELIEPVGKFIAQVGFPIALVMMLGAFGLYIAKLLLDFWKPRWDEAHKANVSERQETCKTMVAMRDALAQAPDLQRQILRTQGCIGRAVHAAAPPERQPHVQPHIDELHREIGE